MQIRSLVRRSNGRLGRGDRRRGGKRGIVEGEKGWMRTGGQSKTFVTSHHDSLTPTKDGWSPDNWTWQHNMQLEFCGCHCEHKFQTLLSL